MSAIQINQPTRCNSFTSLLLDVYVQLNMFRALPHPSSGAYNCINSLWFYSWSVVVTALLVVVWPVYLNCIMLRGPANVKNDECVFVFLPYLSSMKCACALLYYHVWSVCLSVPYFSTLSHKRNDFRENFVERKMHFNFSSNFSCNIFYSKKNSARYYRVSIKSFPDYKHLLQENYVL